MLIIGAKGFAKELIEALRDNQLSDFCFFDDQSEERTGCIFENFAVLKSQEECIDYFVKDKRFALGLGGPLQRRMITDKFRKLNGKLTEIISRKASIGEFNSIGIGVTIMQNVIIENDNTIGEGCLLHTGSFISHDVQIGNFCEISPYSKLLGHSSVGENCSIGTGAIILPRVKIGKNVVVGAGAVVTRDIHDDQTVAGIPAKKIR